MKERAKITLLTASDFPYGGAAENLVRQLALGINKNNVKVEVIRYRGSRYNNTKNDTPVRCSNFLFKRPRNGELANVLELILIILHTPIFIFYRKLFKKDKNIVLYGIEFSFLIVPILFWCKVFRIKCYRFITDIYSEKSIASAWWKKPKLIFYKRQFTRIDKKLNGIIVLSKLLYNLCLEYGVKENNLILIPHFIDTSYSPPTEVKKTTCINIVYVGSLTKSNGIFDLIDAYKIVEELRNNTKLIIIGELSPEISDKIDSFYFKDQNIEFLGFLSKEKIKEILLMSSILVNPRKSGQLAEAGFPTKLGEYFATKKPVVTTRVGDLAKYFTDKEEVIFANPDSPNSLAESIIYLIDKYNIAEEIGNKGYLWAVNHLDYIKNSQKFIEFIDR